MVPRKESSAHCREHGNIGLRDLSTASTTSVLLLRSTDYHNSTSLPPLLLTVLALRITSPHLPHFQDLGCVPRRGCATLLATVRGRDDLCGAPRSSTTKQPRDPLVDPRADRTGGTNRSGLYAVIITASTRPGRVRQARRKPRREVGDDGTRLGRAYGAGARCWAGAAMGWCGARTTRRLSNGDVAIRSFSCPTTWSPYAVERGVGAHAPRCCGAGAGGGPRQRGAVFRRRRERDRPWIVDALLPPVAQLAA